MKKRSLAGAFASYFETVFRNGRQPDRYGSAESRKNSRAQEVTRIKGRGSPRVHCEVKSSSPVHGASPLSRGAEVRILNWLLWLLAAQAPLTNSPPCRC
jgi:hypothetical protein